MAAQPTLEELLAAFERGELHGFEVLGTWTDVRVDHALARALAQTADPDMRERIAATLLWRNTPEAHDALRAQAAAGPEWHGFAARSLVSDRRAGAAALQRLAADARAGDATAAGLVIATLAELAHGGGAVPMPGRWIDAVAALRGSDHIGFAAHRTLCAFPRGDALRAVQRIPGYRSPVDAQRVGQGAYRTAAASPWDELVALPTLSPDEVRRADALATETMERVARNADRIVETLASLGWRFADAARASRESATWTVPPVPLALDAFWRVVGGIDLRFLAGAPPPYWLSPEALRAAAPLVLRASWQVAWQAEVYQGALARHGSVEVVGPFAYELDEDSTLAASATEPLDPWVLHGAKRERFVAYLRHAFRWGGLPGLAYVERSAELDRVIARLTEGLEPF